MASFSGKRLVIFGCGYVGAAVAERAVAAGMSVTALTRNASTARELGAKGVKTITALLADETWHARISADADYVLNTVSAFDATAAGYRASYIDGARSILAWTKRAARPVGTLVYTSSTGVYPQGGGVRVDETAAVDENSGSAAILVEAERLFLNAPAALVCRTFILRLAGIYGPGRHSILDQIRAGVTTITGRGDHRLNLIHRDDIVGAVFAALGAAPDVGSRVFNVSDGNPATKADFVDYLARAIGRPAPSFDPSAPSIRRGGAGIPDRLIDNGRLRAELGWMPAFPDFRAGYDSILKR